MDTRKNLKRENILSAARTLFWKYGIKRVTIEEICMEASVSKMTYYKHFKNKNEVARQVFTDLWIEGHSRYKKIMSKDIPFSQKVEQIISLDYQFSVEISKEFMKDIYHPDDQFGMVDLLEKYQEIQFSTLKKDLSKAQENGDIDKDMKIEFILFFLKRINKQLFDPELAKIYPSTKDLVLALSKLFFFGITARR